LGQGPEIPVFQMGIREPRIIIDAKIAIQNIAYFVEKSTTFLKKLPTS